LIDRDVFYWKFDKLESEEWGVWGRKAAPISCLCSFRAPADVNGTQHASREAMGSIQWVL